MESAMALDVPVVRLVGGEALTVGMDEPIEQVYAFMLARGVRFLAVCQGPRVTAVLDRDNLLNRLVAARQAPRQLLVRDVVRPGMACLPATASVRAAARLMRATSSSAVPVVDEWQHLIGLVTADDVACALGAHG